MSALNQRERDDWMTTLAAMNTLTGYMNNQLSFDAYDSLILQSLSEIVVGYLDGICGGNLDGTDLAARARRSTLQGSIS